MEAGGKLDDAGLGGEHHREPDASGRGTVERKSRLSKGARTSVSSEQGV